MTNAPEHRLECSGCGHKYVIRGALSAGRSVMCEKCGRPLIEDRLRLRDEPAKGVWEIPVRLGRYLILGEIARGGMGVIYRARQEGLQRVVAVKMMLPGPAASEDAVRRFGREARAAAKLRHPNIVSIHEIGEYRNMPFFTMDYVEGVTLDERIAAGPMDPKEAARILRDVARAVHYAHTQGIIHRDLKPPNILVDREGVPRITDFGLAKEVDSKSMLSMTGDIIGTPAYMSPEQADGRVHEMDATSDVYSLGALLYRVITGRPPFEGPTVVTTVYKVIHEYAREPARLNPAVPAELSAICMKALQKEKGRRYASAREMAVDLDRFLKGEPVAAKPVGRWEMVRRKVRGHRAAFRISAASMAMAVVAIALLLILGGESYLDLLERNLGSDNPTARRQALTALLEGLAEEGGFEGGERDRARKLAHAAATRHKDEDTRAAMLSVFERMYVEEFDPLVVLLLESDVPKELLLRALEVAAARRVEDGKGAVLNLLYVDDADVKLAAVKYFQVVPHLGAYNELAALVADPKCGPDARIALRAIYSGGGTPFLGGTGALGTLGETVSDYNKRLAEVEEMLGQMRGKPKDKVEAAIASLSLSDTATRLRAAVELGMHGDARAAKPLLKACTDADDAVARAAGVALRGCGAEEHVGELVALLDHARPAVRIAAASALAGLPEALKALGGRLQKERDAAVIEVLKKAINPSQ
ncbi:MAG: protein kinase domain-containing protein [Planctomycetota bacterium]|jgi:serine/threonine protein kinase